MLRKLFNTGKGSPIYQPYFESGHLPARFQIKRMKLVFLWIYFETERNFLGVSIPHGTKKGAKKRELVLRNPIDIKGVWNSSFRKGNTRITY